MLGQIFAIVGEELKYSFVYLKHQISSSQQSKAKVLVNGSPKSGTTWMLKMIASLPGYENVGNYRGDLQKYHMAQDGNVIHGHGAYTPELKNILLEEGVKVVMMVRDPRDQLVSRMFHVKHNVPHVWNKRMKGLDNDTALMLCIEGRENLPSMRDMVALAQSWINGNAEALCVRYEELLADPVTHFSTVLDYLGIGNNRRMAEMIVERNRFARLSVGKRIWQRPREPGQEDTKSYVRKGIVGDWRNYLTPTHIERFKDICGQQLIDLGYEQNMDW
ncbi:MAG: sulfotransferase domain-containing protein [Chloroflexi bacterium]|nr:sulfotransferase domain-containing protein [Chloroflexota bacterium]